MLRRAPRPQAFISGPILGRLVPAKSLCPDCGMKMRGPSHLCDPTRVERETRRKAALAKLTANK
jgi:hypothetical protein